MTKAWTSRERFSHRGRFWQFDDIVVEPPPAQQPHPPFWVAAGSEASIRRAAARGFNLILDQYASPEAARPAHRALSRRARGARPAVRPDAGRGRAPALCRQGQGRRPRRRWSARRAIHAAHRRRVALRRTARRGSHVLSYADTPGGTEANALFDTPDEICRTARGAAPGRRGVHPADAMAGGREHLRRFARDIMPGFSQAARRQRQCGAERADASPERGFRAFVASCQRRIPLRR